VILEKTIAPDKGKPVVRQGRKAKHLEEFFKEGWLPKAIEEQYQNWRSSFSCPIWSGAFGLGVLRTKVFLSSFFLPNIKSFPPVDSLQRSECDPLVAPAYQRNRPVNFDS
jgi:hypothetical protein